MNKRIAFIFLSVLLSLAVFAQNEEAKPKDDKGKKPVKDPWACTMLVDAQTTTLPYKGSLELVIQHRFTSVQNGIKDLWGLYGASNIRLALSYSITDRFMIGLSTEKDKKYQELFAKYKILEQNRDNSIPLSLSLYGNTCISTVNEDNYGLDYKFIDRLSYFLQLGISRKFTDWFSLLIAPSWAHVNKVESVKVTDTSVRDNNIRTEYKRLVDNDVLGASAAARLKFYNNMSFLLEYDQGFFLRVVENQEQFPMPNAALALEINSNTHCFQVFASTYRGIIPQQNLLYNQMDCRKLKDLMLGFNITVRLK